MLDPVTGVYVTALICRDHWDEVAAAAHAAPDPPLDRGGVLARTFPEWDLDVVYSWVDPRYEPGVIPGEYAGRPRLRVVGGAS